MKKPKLIKIKDVPYLYIDDLLDGYTLEEAINNIKAIKSRLKEAIAKADKKDVGLTPFSKYKEIRFVIYDYESRSIAIEALREQTPEEAKQEAATKRKQFITAKERAKRQAEDKLAEEKAEYERLKKEIRMTDTTNTGGKLTAEEIIVKLMPTNGINFKSAEQVVDFMVSCMKQYAQQELTALQAENERLRKDKWVSVEDRLPEFDFIGYGALGYLLFKQSDTHHTTESFCKQFGITHWQLLPSPPTF